MIADKCLVLLSGGQDTATCLAWAKKEFQEVYAITFDYSQPHFHELECAQQLAMVASIKKHEIILLPNLFEITNNPVIIPNRNMIFLTISAAYAMSYNISHLVAGMGQVDYSNYSDCRDSSVRAVQVALQLNCDIPIFIHTPLMWKSKAETIQMLQELDCMEWLEFTHTCYQNKRPPCGECDACILRAKGFEEAGVNDPIIVWKK
jgi:7-cyano-7-deazaguanine synthase